MLGFYGFGGIGVGQKSICSKGGISVVPRALLVWSGCTI